MPRTSNKAEKIVEFVNAFIAENGYSPSVREIGEAVGLRSTASVSYHLQALQEKGVFQAPEAKGRKRALVTGARPGQIPVIGVVTAGLPILAVENQEGTIPWEDPTCYALRVRGDSMINAGILSGDKVIVRRRLLELGLVAGTRVRCLGRSPLGDPSAYEIRGAVIALRDRDSAGVLVEGEAWD